MEMEIIQETENIELKVEKPEKAVVESKRPKLPEKYSEIYISYTKKEYQECLEIIADVSESHIEYEILKSACIIHMGKNLDEVIVNSLNNVFINSSSRLFLGPRHTRRNLASLSR